MTDTEPCSYWTAETVPKPLPAVCNCEYVNIRTSLKNRIRSTKLLHKRNLERYYIHVTNKAQNTPNERWLDTYQFDLITSAVLDLNQDMCWGVKNEDVTVQYKDDEIILRGKMSDVVVGRNITYINRADLSDCVVRKYGTVILTFYIVRDYVWLNYQNVIRRWLFENVDVQDVMEEITDEYDVIMIACFLCLAIMVSMYFNTVRKKRKI